MNKQYTIAVLGSHSALDVCRGAKDLGFKTLVVCQKGREKTYQKYYKRSLKFSLRSNFKKIEEIGCVDECILLDKFADILKPEIQKKLIAKNCIFIPHRSFEVYINDYDAIEKKFKVPMFGNRFLLKLEERGVKPNQYDLLNKAKIRYPKQFKDPKDIDRIVLVKVQEKERGYERAFFIAKDSKEFESKAKEKMGREDFTKEQLASAVIEEFILGVQVNFNFFFSPINNRLELIGTDTRRQTNQEGVMKLTKELIDAYLESGGIIKYEEASHTAVTVLESLLEEAFDLGERFIKAAQDLISPGVIGPFALQTVITPGPPKKEIIVFDVSPRMPGSPGIFATPYSSYLYGQNISMGKRVAMEIKEAITRGKLEKVIT